MKRLGPNQDFASGELQNFVVHRLAGAPSSPKPGQVYTNSTNGVMYQWNGTAWRPHDAAALTDASIQNSALQTNPLARPNHTGVQPASSISDLSTTVKGYSLDQFTAPAANVSWNNFRLVSLADPTGAQDAATKNYVDGAVQSAAAGIDSKPSVRVVAVANITLSATQTIDGIALASGDRVLAAAQSTASQNGVYVVASGAWTRATDADQTGEITPGAFWFVEEGTSYGKTQWRCNNTGTVTIGTTAITIVQFGAAASYTASLGVQLVGSDFRLLLDTNPGLSVSASGVKIMLGTNSGLQLLAGGLSVLLPTASGLVQDATGLHTDRSSVIRTPIITKGTVTGDGSAVSFTVTHNLGTKDIGAWFRDSSDVAVDIDWTATSTSAMTVTFGTAPPNGTTYTVVIVGY